MATENDIKNMVFVDGENLVMRYQAMLAAGSVPRQQVAHVPDVFIWQPSMTDLIYTHGVFRVTYYTYGVGDSTLLTDIADQLQSLPLNRSAAWNARSLTPCIMKKVRKQQ